jgi:hypothetical protein
VKPQYIKFCYAICHGDTFRARQLLYGDSIRERKFDPKIDISEKDNFGINPLCFILAVLQMHPRDGLRLLKALYPTVEDPCPAGHLDKTCTAETFSRTVRQLLRHTHISYTHVISSAATMAAFCGTPEQKENIQQIARASLEYVSLNFTLNAQTQALIKNLQKDLKPAATKKLVTKVSSFETRQKTQQASLKTLAAILNGSSPTFNKGEEDLFGEWDTVTFGFNSLSLNPPTHTLICASNEIRLGYSAKKPH